MSELINNREDHATIRWRLLTSASVVALLVSTACEAQAVGGDRPQVWVELGGQLESVKNSDEQFSVPFAANFPANFFSPLSVQKPLSQSIDEEGSISFAPPGTDWVFSASVRFGRSNGIRKQHQQTANALVPVHFSISKYGQHHYFGGFSYYPYGHVKFEDAKARRSETHAILDFQVGKDVGLGMFGNRNTSVVSAGVRIAQFTSKANVSVSAQPDVQYQTAPISSFAAKYAFLHPHLHFHGYAASLNAQRSFQGIGPTLAWMGSAPFGGNAEGGEVTFDWGANGSILFGRQKTRGHHQTTTRSYYATAFGANPGARNGNIRPGYVANYLGIRHSHSTPADFSRTRSVVVPNLGGFAGLSYRYANAKLSLGYRADFFFGAMDGGIDTHRAEDVGFHGPFAAISVGLGG